MSTPVISSRTHGQVILYLPRKSSVPTLPYELHKHVSADAWAVRIPQLIRLSNRYNRPVLEGIWFILMFIAMLVLPVALHDSIRRSLKQRMSRDDAQYQTRFVSFAIVIGIVMLFVGPHMAWKFMGQKRATELVKRWETEDARLRSPGAFIPVWTVKLPGYLSTNTSLTVTIPHAAIPTYFHPAAYMPSWINGPADPGAPDGVPATYQGFQQQPMYGEIPLYGNTDGSTLPPYVGDGTRGYTDEKSGLDETRV
jgi:hypothetical protein